MLFSECLFFSDMEPLAERPQFSNSTPWIDPHWITQGVKIQSGQISLSNMSNYSSILKDFKNILFFWIQLMVVKLWAFEGQRWIMHLYRVWKLYSSDFLANGVKSYSYQSAFRKRIVCTVQNAKMQRFQVLIDYNPWSMVTLTFWSITPQWNIRGSANYYFSGLPSKDKQIDTIFKKIGAVLIFDLHVIS